MCELVEQANCQRKWDLKTKVSAELRIEEKRKKTDIYFFFFLPESILFFLTDFFYWQTFDLLTYWLTDRETVRKTGKVRMQGRDLKRIYERNSYIRNIRKTKSENNATKRWIYFECKIIIRVTNISTFQLSREFWRHLNSDVPALSCDFGKGFFFFNSTH